MIPVTVDPYRILDAGKGWKGGRGLEAAVRRGQDDDAGAEAANCSAWVPFCGTYLCVTTPLRTKHLQRWRHALTAAYRHSWVAAAGGELWEGAAGGTEDRSCCVICSVFKNNRNLFGLRLCD